MGVPNLWIPKTVRRVEAIPVLASGKLDLVRCNELAESA
jgi:acyl-[acyl-carrier-protein]-phospholipid O-acyltransferase/long-chain-fatty-acid--[acyl-carrier-protein] ligase